MGNSENQTSPGDKILQRLCNQLNDEFDGNQAGDKMTPFNYSPDFTVPRPDDFSVPRRGYGKEPSSYNEAQSRSFNDKDRNQLAKEEAESQSSNCSVKCEVAEGEISPMDNAYYEDQDVEDSALEKLLSETMKNKDYAGEWVFIDKEKPEVLSHDRDYESALERAKRKRPKARLTLVFVNSEDYEDVLWG